MGIENYERNNFEFIFLPARKFHFSGRVQRKFKLQLIIYECPRETYMNQDRKELIHLLRLQ